MPKFDFQLIPAPLLSWYGENKRDLPWRKEPTPYRVWVSEIMLQQTRVEAVKEYYARFMQALPTVEDLAKCEEEKLLKLWEGLGYYSRARNLQKTAKIISAQYNGEFPRDIRELTALPGIGSYTAGAIASIAFGMPAPAVDGNVFRVASRLEENPTPISDPKYRKYLEETLVKFIPRQGRIAVRSRKAYSSLARSYASRNPPIARLALLQGFAGRTHTARKRLFPLSLPKNPSARRRCTLF
ncbi:MAG: A/G-specific adenine glycosylase [Clostridia bacterium]|nr:A/G-specific adenine glycosylase [Clostridia bacterium]